MKPCTSNYAVEARASAWESAAKSLRTPAHKSVPFGRNVARLLDEAAALLRALVAERDEAQRIANGGCARDQRTTQFCGIASDAYARGFREGAETMRGTAIDACKSKQKDFASPQYKAGQPMSSFEERFACGACAEVIEVLPLPEPQA